MNFKIGKYKGKHSYRKKDIPPYNRNNFIKAPKVFVVTREGEKLGIMPTKEAIEIAKSKDLDLIEVAPKANPPVAKIMSWSKFKYRLQKKKKESKNKSTELKEMWFKPFIEEGDLEHKLKKVEEFIKEKNPVKLTIRASGRVQKQHLFNLMDKILKKIEKVAEPQKRPKFQGRNLALIVKPRKTKLNKSDKNNEK